MVYPQNFEYKIGFDKIRNLLKELCLSALGRERVDNISFLTNYSLIHQFINQVEEFKNVCQHEDNFPLNYYLDCRPFLEKAKIEGTYIEAEELVSLQKSLLTVKAVLNFFKNDNDLKYNHLLKLTEKIKLYPYIYDEIEKIINKHGKIKDKASTELAHIRKKISSKQANVSKQISKILNSAKEQGWVDADVSLSIRNGRMVIPVLSANKRKINGFVHDESSTGKTSFIEPSEIVETNNEIKELEYAEKREIIKILINFTNNIRPYIDELIYYYQFLGIIDFIRAKTLLAIKLKSIKPAFVNERIIDWHNAKHPLLFLSHIKENKRIVPLTIFLDHEQRIILISGPNAGGKSVCLKTVGLLQYMLQCGLLVPMSEQSKMGIFENIFIDIGDEQSIENDLSTYSSHLLNMKYFIRKTDENTLLLIDEFGTGTEPMLGGAIAESLLNKLNDKNTFGVITTHYTNLKHFASQKEGIVNGAMLYDSNKLEPIFQLEIGKPGSSFAFEIARKIGLPEDILDSAKEKIGEEHIHFDKHLKNIVRDKRYWENKRKKIRISEKKLLEIIEKQSKELNEAQSKKKNIVEQANIEAKELLSSVNKKIENTIRKIKESDAEKEKTKSIRKEFEEFKTNIEKKQDSHNKIITDKIHKLKKIENQLKKKNPELVKEKPIKNKNEPDYIIRIGDKVKIIDQQAAGEVIDMNEKNIVIGIGNIITTISKDKLEKISNNEFRRITGKRSSSITAWDPHKRKLNFKPGIDIRGKRADEALRIVAEYIDEAIVVEAKEVKILHGKGDGILRQIIRDYLKTINLIKSCNDEHIDAGGAGITVVNF
ncbi:MAG: Smr/MutS family protein [Bacteroidales bacterium]|nr:Smr/MutS family protein [Bacteroidales bacterium]